MSNDPVPFEVYERHVNATVKEVAALRKERDAFGLALRMIAAGTDDPAGFAKQTLERGTSVHPA